jgi:hypothetical protein
VGGPQTLQSEGPWALQRLFDKAQIAPGSTADSQNATFDIGGRKLTLRMVAGTASGDALARQAHRTVLTGRPKFDEREVMQEKRPRMSHEWPILDKRCPDCSVETHYTALHNSYT